MLFARWQHHIWFGSGFPYAPLKAMLTKISKWSKIHDSFRITPKIKPLVVFAIPDTPRKFQKNSFITFWVILLTHRQTNKLWQKHNLLGGGNNTDNVRLPSERVVVGIAVKDFDVIRLAGVMSLEPEGVEVELNEEAWRSSNKPCAVDAVRVNARVLGRPEWPPGSSQHSAAFYTPNKLISQLTNN